MLPAGLHSNMRSKEIFSMSLNMQDWKITKQFIMQRVESPPLELQQHLLKKLKFLWRRKKVKV